MNFELQSLITKTTWFIDIHTGLNDREIAESTTNVRDGTRPIFDFKAKRISLKEVSDNYHHTFIEHIYTLSTVVQIDLDSLRYFLHCLEAGTLGSCLRASSTILTPPTFV